MYYEQIILDIIAPLVTNKEQLKVSPYLTLHISHS